MKTNVATTLEILSGVEPFRALDGDSLAGLASRCRLVEMGPREVLLHDGQQVGCAYVLARGCLSRSLMTSEGRRVMLNHTHPVTAFCCAATLDGGAHLGVIEAREPSLVVCVPTAAITEALERSAAFSLAMVRNLARSSVRQTQAIHELLFPVPVRLARLICRMSAESGSIELEASKAALAEMLATVPETLSRALGTLRAKGFVETRGHRLRVLNMAALQAYAML